MLDIDRRRGEENALEICVGIDWGEGEHAALVMDGDGKTLRRLKASDSIDDLERLHGVIADYAEDPADVSVGIETDRGLLVQSFVAAGYQVYAINPKLLTGIEIGIRSRVPSRIRATRRCSRMWCVPTATTIGSSRRTLRWWRESRSSLVHIRV